MAEPSPAAILLARVVPSVCLSGDELETVRAELDRMRESSFASARMYTTIQKERDDSRWELHQEREAHALAKAALDDANTEIARLRDAAREVDKYVDFSHATAAGEPWLAPEKPEEMNAAMIALHRLIHPDSPLHQDSPAPLEDEGSPTQPPTAAPGEVLTEEEEASASAWLETIAAAAQLEEHRPRSAEVTGSIPVSGSITFKWSSNTYPRWGRTDGAHFAWHLWPSADAGEALCGEATDATVVWLRPGEERDPDLTCNDCPLIEERNALAPAPTKAKPKRKKRMKCGGAACHLDTKNVEHHVNTDPDCSVFKPREKTANG